MDYPNPPEFEDKEKIKDWLETHKQVWKNEKDFAKSEDREQDIEKCQTAIDALERLIDSL